jgi:hypothetical protein
MRSKLTPTSGQHGREHIRIIGSTRPRGTGDMPINPMRHQCAEPNFPVVPCKVDLPNKVSKRLASEAAAADD